MFRGVYTAPPTAGEGVQFVYIPEKQVIRVEGWHNQGRIQATDLPLGDFLRGLGVTVEDCQQALGMTTTAPVVGQPVAAQSNLRAASQAPATTVSTPSEVPPKAA